MMTRTFIFAAFALSANALLLHQGVNTTSNTSSEKASEKASADVQVQQGSQQRLRVVSDFHLGGCWSAHEQTRVKLMKFLEEMVDPANDNGPPITHLAILGDMWDWWLVPLDKEIPKPEELFENTESHGFNIPKVISLIKEIGKRMKVYLVRGNHDDISSVELTQKAFGDSVQFMEDGFELNGVWMEHGNIYDMYSTVPRRPDEPKRQGFSYFVTRSQAGPESYSCKRAVTEGRDGAFHDAMAKMINNQVHMLEHFAKPDFAADPTVFAPKYLESLVHHLDNWKDIPISGMKADGISFDYHSKESNYTLGDAVRDHADDGQRMLEKYGEKGTMARLFATGSDNARMFSKMNQKHLVFITGHSHMPYVERVQRDKKSKVSSELVYANSGAWTFDTYGRHLHSFVDVTFDKVKDLPGLEEGSWRPSVVKWFEYPEKEPRETVEVPIPKSDKFYGWELDMHPDKTEMILGSGADGIRLEEPPQM